MMRTSTRRVFDEPTRSNSPACSTRRSFACWVSERFAISSRKSVPWSASSKRPARSVFASVKAPFVWPNISLSNTPSASPPRFTVTIGAAGARRRGVQPGGDDLLPRAVFAGDERVRVGGADPLHEAEHRLHRRRLGDELRRAAGAQRLVLALEPLAAADRAAELHLRADHVEEAFVVEGLLDVVARAAAQRFDRALDAPPRGHHDDRERGVHVLEAREEVEPLGAAGGVAHVVHVHQERVEIALLDGGEHGGGGGGGLHLVALAAEEQLEGVEDVARVVGDEEPGGSGRHRR